MDENVWRQNNYEVELTQDGSPSLHWLGGGHDESMHHSGGAWKETWYIYGETLRAAFQQGAKTVTSVGLGIAYNEFLSLRLAHSLGIKFRLQSYESNEFLVKEFLNFLRGDAISSETKAVYDLMLKFVEATHLRESLLKMYEDGDFVIHGALTATPQKQPSAVILYDAFSSKATPELWQEDFLDHFLQSEAEEKCLFSTYGCTGALKRSRKMPIK